MRLSPAVALAATLALSALAAPLAAQPPAAGEEAVSEAPAAREGDRLGWHVVRPGETLRSITRRYLGTTTLWRENHRLNPQIVNPHFLLPGQRLRVILERDLPERSAEVTQVARKVEEKPQPHDWQAARRGDLLAERDGVRTFERSSAELTFDDGVRLAVTENSLVFLQRLDQTLTGVQQETVEIVEGQADLAARRRPRQVSDIEIVVGGATARPRPGGDGRAENRARAAGEAAQLMVYAGESEVEAAGATVDVPRGMGTVVPEGEAPAPPERLLPAPRLTAPAAGESLAFANPVLRWQPVAGAAHYTVEVCGDPNCGELVARAAGLAAAEPPSWQPERLPARELHWRVTATAASGLDGFPASARLLTVGGDEDRLPPVVAVVRRGAGVAAGDRVVLGPGGTLVLSARDDVSGVAEVRYRWDGGAWTVWRGEELRPGGERLEVQAVDRAGRRSQIWAVTVELDEEPPEPPRLGS